MGYYVQCNLEIENATEKELKLIHDYIEAYDFYGIFPNGDYKCEGSWKTRFDDFKKLSLTFSNVLFKLYVLGEDGERFLEYYKNGQYKRTNAIITYEPWED